MKTVSAADANRHFSSVLRDVASGQVVTVLSRGKPVATIGPIRAKNDQRQAAKNGLLERLNRQPASGQRDWSRDELYGT
jgi:prevent-host-death family protein